MIDIMLLYSHVGLHVDFVHQVISALTCSPTELYWLQRWARVYRDDQYHAAVETNNGTEAMNKLMKYRYLPRRKNITLSTVTSTTVEGICSCPPLQVCFQEFQADVPIQDIQPFSCTNIPTGTTKIHYTTLLAPQSNKQQIQL